MTPEFELFLQVVLETLTLFVLIVGLVGLIVPVFPGLVIMWLGTLFYALLQNAAGNMSGWKWLMFGIITILMIAGSIGDNLIIASKMRDKYVPWSSILFAFAAGIIASVFFTPLIGLVAAPAGAVPRREQKTEGPRRCRRLYKGLYDRLGLGIWTPDS